MGVLKDKIVYLSGAIQHQDTSADWRPEPVRILQERFGLNVFDPHADPKQKWVPVLEQAQKDKDYQKIAEIAKKFVRKDLAMVDHAHLVIAYLPYKVPTTGVCHEVVNSNNEKKPTLLVTNCGDIAYIPVWYYGFISLEFMFPSWDKLYEYLAEVDAGEHKHNDRWSLVYGDI